MTAPFPIAEAIQRVADAKTGNFAALIALAGLDPKRHLRFADWSGIAFSGSLEGCDFTGACLIGSTLESGETWIAGARFDQAIIDEVVPGAQAKPRNSIREAVDWAEHCKRWTKPERWPSDEHLLPGMVFQDAPLAPECVVIPPGAFTMGSPDDEPGRTEDEGPRHEVTIPHALAVGRYAVTFEEWDFAQADKDWASVTGIKPRKPDDRKWGPGRRPVIDVSWDDAKAYAKWLSHRTGQAYRLLSEAEWEYAARAGSGAAWCFGGDESLLGEYAWHFANSDRRTQPVGEKKPNDFGLYDMHGNVWEWCEDVWHENYEDKPDELILTGGAWTTGDSRSRVLRGGSWGSYPLICRAAWRSRFLATYRDNNAGFRVARTLFTP
jgi:formylglycine-generating enzyme required for sulfatase activity